MYIHVYTGFARVLSSFSPRLTSEKVPGFVSRLWSSAAPIGQISFPEIIGYSFGGFQLFPTAHESLVQERERVDAMAACPADSWVGLAGGHGRWSRQRKHS